MKNRIWGRIPTFSTETGFMKVLFKESWLIRDRAEKLVKISPWFYSSKEKFSFDLNGQENSDMRGFHPHWAIV